MNAPVSERLRPRAAEAPGTVFSPDLAVLRLSPGAGARGHLGLADALAVVQRMRDAILSHSNHLPEQVQALLSGHGEGGSPLLHPHLAILPIASVGSPRADGRLTGLALAMPRSVPEEDRLLALRTVGQIRRLMLGRLGVWNVAMSNEEADAWTAYPAGATHWSTVTPLVFDTHPKGSGEGAGRQDLVAMVSRACTHVGLGEPREVIAVQVSAHTGIPPAHSFPRLRRKDGHERRHAHVIITFDHAITGPLILGAGRYRGYGLFRPLHRGVYIPDLQETLV